MKGKIPYFLFGFISLALVSAPVLRTTVLRDVTMKPIRLRFPAPWWNTSS